MDESKILRIENEEKEYFNKVGIKQIRLIPKIQKFKVEIEVDFSDMHDDWFKYNAAPYHFFKLNNEDIFEDTKHYSINELIDYQNYYKRHNKLFDSINHSDKKLSDIEYLLIQIYFEDFINEEPLWINKNQIKIISIQGYLEED